MVEKHASSTAVAPLGSVIPALLAERGIDTVFGIPGVHTIELYRGLASSSLKHVTPRHEQGAGFMADGYARSTGRPAACFIVTGPGLLNIATAMVQAMADSVPMLVITTLNRRATLGRRDGRLHELAGQSAVAREVAVLAMSVQAKEQLVPALDEAFTVFSSLRPGPVLIEIPIDLLSEPFEVHLGRPMPAPPPPVPDDGVVIGVATVLNAAKRPLVIAGGGAVRGAPRVRELVEKLGAPTLLTANAQGLLPPGHPLLAGGCLALPPIRALIKEADVVLAFGTEFGETDFEYYDEGPVELGGALIRVDIDPRQLVRNVVPTHPIVGEAGLVADALTPLIHAGATDGPARAKAAREAGLAAVEPRMARQAPLLDTLWRTLPNAIVAGDSTVISYAACLFGEPPAPRRFMSARTGFGTLGYALPAAIGAKLAHPEAAAVCVIGDGGLHYTMAELAAAADAKAPVIVLLWNDRSYGEIKLYMETAKVEPVGVKLYPTDFSRIAGAFGCAHVTAASLDDLAAALASAASSPVSTLIEMDASLFAL